VRIVRLGLRLAGWLWLCNLLRGLGWRRLCSLTLFETHANGSCQLWILLFDVSHSSGVSGLASNDGTSDDFITNIFSWTNNHAMRVVLVLDSGNKGLNLCHLLLAGISEAYDINSNSIFLQFFSKDLECLHILSDC